MSYIKVECSNCGYRREMPASALPPGPVTATCPKCKQTFAFPSPVVPVPNPAEQQIKSHSSPRETTKHSRLQGSMDNGGNKLLLGVFVTLIVITVIVRLWADAAFKAVPYPNLLAVSPEGIAVSVGHAVYLYGSDGKPLHTYPLPKEVQPTQLFWDNGVLCVADIRSKSILKLTRNGSDFQTFTGATISVQFKVAREPATGRFFVSDSANHRVLVFDPTGRFIRSFGKEGRNPGEFRFPNEMAFDEAGQLLIANTKQPAVEMYSPEGQYNGALVTPKGRTYLYPTDLAVTPERLLVLENDGFLEKAKVRVYDRKGCRRGELALGDTTVIGDLAADSERIYVTNCDKRKLLAYSLGDLRPLGPVSSDFENKCAQWNSQAERYHTISLGALAALLLLCAPVIYLYWKIKNEEAKAVSKVELEMVSPKGPKADPNDLIVAVPVNSLQRNISVAIFGTGILAAVTSAIFAGLRFPPLYHLSTLMVAVISIPVGIIILARAGGFTNWKRKQTETFLKRVIHDGMLSLLPEEQVEKVALSQHEQSGQNFILLVFSSKRLLLYHLNWNKVAEIEQFPYESIAEVIPPSKGGVKVLETMLVTTVVEGKKQSMKYVHHNADFLLLLCSEFASRKGRVSGLPYAKLCLTCRQPLQGDYCATCATKLAPDRRAMWLSFIFPGLGQLRNGDIQKGLTFAVMAVVMLLAGYLGIKGWFFEGADLNLKQKYNLIVLMIMGPVWYIANIVDAYQFSIKGRKPGR